jgi:hypothetical protein
MEQSGKKWRNDFSQPVKGSLKVSSVSPGTRTLNVEK